MLSQFLLINELQLYVTNQNCYLHGNKFELTSLERFLIAILKWITGAKSVIVVYVPNILSVVFVLQKA